MSERYEVRDARGDVIAHVWKEDPLRFPYSGPLSRATDPSSPVVDTVCRIVSLVLLAMMVLFCWVMATVT